MVNNYPVDYREIRDKVFSHYLEEQYCPLNEPQKEYRTEEKEVNTIDEYIRLLSQGYINIELHSDLDKYLTELLEDDWFFQWPLVRWTYGSRLLYGTGHRKSVKRAVEILSPLAKEGCPSALYDIGFCYCYSEGIERNYEKAICLWIESSRMGYQKAWESLYNHYSTNQYNILNDELKYFFIYELYIHFPESKGCTWEDYEKYLSKNDIAVMIKIYKEGIKLDKIISKNFRSYSIARLFWDDENNPYRIKF